MHQAEQTLRRNMTNSNNSKFNNSKNSEREHDGAKVSNVFLHVGRDHLHRDDFHNVIQKVCKLLKYLETLNTQCKHLFFGNNPKVFLSKFRSDSLRK